MDINLEELKNNPDKIWISFVLAIVAVIINHYLNTENSNELIGFIFSTVFGGSLINLYFFEKHIKKYITKIVSSESKKYFDKENLEIIVKTKEKKTK